MSFLFSDSLAGIISEESLDDATPRVLGKITVGKESYDVDAFLTDGAVMRLHAIGDVDDATGMISLVQKISADIKIGDNDLVASGIIRQVGWERLPHGNRIVISMSVRDK